MTGFRQQPRAPRGQVLVAIALLAAAAALLLDWGPAGTTFAEPRGVSARPAAQPRSSVRMHWGSYNRYSPIQPDGQYKHDKDIGKEEQDLQGYVMFADMEKSVFDGNKEKRTIIDKYWGKKFVIQTDNWEYELYDVEDDEEEWPRTGLWSKDFRMPMNGPHGFTAREPELRREYNGMVKKLRKKHSHGHRYPNGKAVYLTKVQHIPFTREIYGEKYAGKAPWLLKPSEVALRKRQLEAQRLKRRLEQEAEVMRINRLRNLGIFAGEQEWRRPWQPKVDVLTGELLEELQDVSLPESDFDGASDDEDESEDEDE